MWSYCSGRPADYSFSTLSDTIDSGISVFCVAGQQLIIALKFGVTGTDEKHQECVTMISVTGGAPTPVLRTHGFDRESCLTTSIGTGVQVTGLIIILTSHFFT